MKAQLMRASNCAPSVSGRPDFCTMTVAVRIVSFVPEHSQICSSKHQRRPQVQRRMSITCSVTRKDTQKFQSLTGLRDLAQSGQFKRRDDPWFSALGRTCIHMTWSERGAISLEGLGLQVVEHLEGADFILAHGTEAIGLANGTSVQPKKLEDLEQILEHSVDSGIPMIVANPDHVTVEARALQVMPGMLGSKYEKMGGQVRWMGKPDQVIYKAAKEMTGVDIAECIAVGDSLHHDILGANISGMKSVFVAGGIHANEVGVNQFGMVPEEAAVEALTHSYGAYPSYIIPSFTW